MSTPAPTPAAPPTPPPTPSKSAMGWNCGICRYAAVMSDGSLQCRHDPPGLLINTNGTVMSVWPNVLTIDWCGEYDPAPT